MLTAINNFIIDLMAVISHKNWQSRRMRQKIKGLNGLICWGKTGANRLIRNTIKKFFTTGRLEAEYPGNYVSYRIQSFSGMKNTEFLSKGNKALVLLINRVNYVIYFQRVTINWRKHCCKNIIWKVKSRISAGWYGWAGNSFSIWT